MSESNELMIEAHYTPCECHLLPSLVMCVVMCDHCSEIHAWQLIGQFFWWGFTITLEAEAE